ncbi:MAG: N-acetylmuramoyl-L-alanine amidase [Rickettsiales bacterium]|nr:N-acetylmuramoyl-L-alanine amidase [Rickettsiales bacterium]
MPNFPLNKSEILLNKQQAEYLLWNTLLGANGIVPKNLEADINLYVQTDLTASWLASNKDKQKAYQSGFEAFQQAYNNYISQYGDGTKSLAEIENYIKSIGSNPIKFLGDNGASQETIDAYRKIQANSSLVRAFQNYNVTEQNLTQAGYQFPKKEEVQSNAQKPANKTKPPAAPANANKGKFKVENPDNLPVVVIDVGHGWTGSENDTGAIVGATSEFQINQANAEILKGELEKKGFFVVLTSDVRTRENVGPGENFPSRYQVAKDNDAVMYISMHADSNDSKSQMGIITYYDDKEPEILVNRKKVNFSRDLACDISTSCSKTPKFIKKEDERDAPVAKIDKAGKKTAIYSIPSVLLEMGNMQNAEDLANMLNPEWQSQIFASMANAMAEYYTKNLGASKGPLVPLAQSESPVVNTTSTPTPPVTPSEPKFDENYTPSFSKSGDDNGIFSGVDKADFAKGALDFITQPNGTPVMNLFLLIFKAIGAIVGLFVGKKQGDAVANMGEEFKSEIMNQIVVANVEQAKSAGLDAENNRYSMTEDAYKRMLEFQENLIKDGSNFLLGKLTPATTEEQRNQIFAEFRDYMSKEIKEKFPKFSAKDYVEIPLEKDGKTAYFFEEGNKTKIVYLNPDELAMYGAGFSSKLEEVKKYEGIYWPVYNSEALPTQNSPSKN